MRKQFANLSLLQDSQFCYISKVGNQYKNYLIMRKKKFIVVEDIKGNIRLRLGYPFYHRDLLCRNEDCLGGGEWDIDFDTKQIKLFGKSDDFGAVNPKILQKAIDNINVHTSWQIENIVESVYDKEIDLNDFSIIRL